MTNKVLDEIKDFAVKKLNNEYGFCGLTVLDGYAMLNSNDKKGKDIKITITIKAEEE